MKINLSPVRADQPITVERQGDSLIIDGEVFDFSVIPEGAVLPASAISSPHFLDTVTRVDGVLELTLRLPHGATCPPETCSPVPIVDPANGLVPLPPYDLPTPELPSEDLE